MEQMFGYQLHILQSIKEKMALEKTLNDKLEIVDMDLGNLFKFVQLQLLKIMGKKFLVLSRRVINPDADWSSEDTEIKLFVI